MTLEELVVGETYLYEGREVIYEGVCVGSTVYVTWAKAVTHQPFHISVDRLRPLGSKEESGPRTRFDRMGAQVRAFEVTSAVCVDPFEFPMGAVGVRDGDVISVYATSRGELGKSFGEFSSEKVARAFAGAYVASLGEPREGPEGYMILREGGVSGQVELASLLSMRLFGEVFSGMGKIRLNVTGEWGALAIEKVAWNALPKVQREAILRFILGFGSGFEYGKQESEG